MSECEHKWILCAGGIAYSGDVSCEVCLVKPSTEIATLTHALEESYVVQDDLIAMVKQTQWSGGTNKHGKKKSSSNRHCRYCGRTESMGCTLGCLMGFVDAIKDNRVDTRGEIICPVCKLPLTNEHYICGAMMGRNK